jgi:predicted aspartyl protease
MGIDTHGVRFSDLIEHPEYIPRLALKRGRSATKLEHISTWIAVAVCGIHVAAAQGLAPSAVLPPRASPVAEKPLVTPTPLPTSPLMTVPKLSQKEIATTSAILNSFLRREGFGFVKLNQKDLDSDPKRLVIDAEINRASALLEVDTGAGGTVIARESLKKFRLVENKTSIGVPTFGKKFAPTKFWGLTKLDTLALGNSVIHTVPVGVKDIPHLDGFLGTPELHRVGAVLDSVGSALYVAHRGPSRHTSDKLAVMLQRNGFTQVPLRLNADYHLEVACSIDGVPSTILVDTGSQFTFVDGSIGTRAGIATQSITKVRGSDGAALSIGRVKKFAIGDFEIKDADICFIDLKNADHPSTYLLGISELASNFAIIDIGGLTMYLRHPQQAASLIE